MTRVTALPRRLDDRELDERVTAPERDHATVALEPAVARGAAPLRSRATLARFLLLYVAMYAAYGVASPFFPAFLAERGVSATQLGVLLGAATAIRLVAAPLAARAGEALRRVRGVFIVSLLAASAATLGLLPVHGFWPLLALALLHAAVMAPINVLADALALAHARPTKATRGFEYGWVRGAGSAAFVAGMLLAGHAVTALGLALTIRLQAGLLALATVFAMLVPRMIEHRSRPVMRAAERGAVGAGVLLRSAPFRRLVLVAALLLGSHALHDAFAVIRWTAAGIDAGTASILWSASVAAEVLVFLVAGPRLVSKLTPAGAIALAAGAGALRWAIASMTTHVALLLLIQPLHGLTFALFHLSAVRLIGRVAPMDLQATALAVYTTGAGATTALLTLGSGALYALIGGAAFWAMAALCVAALLLAIPLRERSPATARGGRPAVVIPLRKHRDGPPALPAPATSEASAV